MTSDQIWTWIVLPPVGSVAIGGSALWLSRYFPVTLRQPGCGESGGQASRVAGAGAPVQSTHDTRGRHHSR
jgi:hypothetical protein